MFVLRCQVLRPRTKIRTKTLIYRLVETNLSGTLIWPNRWWVFIPPDWFLLVPSLHHVRCCHLSARILRHTISIYLRCCHVLHPLFFHPLRGFLLLPRMWIIAGVARSEPHRVYNLQPAMQLRRFAQFGSRDPKQSQRSTVRVANKSWERRRRRRKAAEAPSDRGRTLPEVWPPTTGVLFDAIEEC